MSQNKKIEFCECGCGEPAPIAAKTNTKFGHIKGEPVRFIRGHSSRTRYGSVKERFWKKVNRRNLDDCWAWQAYTDSDGYGTFSIGGISIRAHRVSYELHHGEIPDGMLVLHKCDNPPCVNPAHLFLGTQQDNVDDMTEKERRNSTRGIKNGNAKLTPEKVRRIRELYKDGTTQKDIASRFEVCHQSISNIIRGKSWRHIE